MDGPDDAQESGGFAAFVDALRRDPGGPAIVTDAGVVSRGVLDAASAAVAARAAAAGVAPGACVLLLLPLDADGIVGYVAGLRTGATLVPLDPDVPDAYAADVASRTGAQAAIVTPTTRAAADRLGLHAVVAEVGAPPVSAVPRPRPAGDDAARITFTSGSTGRPKGVIVAFDQEYWGDRPLGPGPIAVLTPLGASAARFSVLDAVVHGNPLCPYDVRVSGLDGLEAFLRRHHAAELLVPVGLFRRLAATLGERRLTDVALVRLWGEAIGLDDLRAVQRHAGPDATVDCRYGASESGAVAVRTVRVRDPLPEVLTYPDLDAGVEVTLEDADGRVVPSGAWGEIVVRGGTVRSGYLDDPELDAARFFRTPDGRRGYRTGDLGRYLPDGSLEVLGRVDDQVSVRGTNVHLTVVEQAVRTVPGVEDCAVLAGDDGHGGQRLAALVVTGPGAHSLGQSPVTAAAIRHHLRATFPPAAVPSVFRTVPSLPRLTGGKLDRAAALVLVDTAPALPAGRPTGPAATPDERAVAAVVADVLGLTVDEIGTDDDFFDLGGDSLAAEELVARLAATFGGRLTRGDVLAAPTVSALARHVRDKRSTSGLVRLQPGGDGLPIFLAPGAGAEPFDLLRLAQHLGRDHPVYSYRSPFFDRRGLAPYGVRATARHYLRLLQAELGERPVVLAGYSAGAMVAFEMAQLVTARGGHVPLFASLDGPAPGRRGTAGPPAPFGGDETGRSALDELRGAPPARRPLLAAKIATRPVRTALRRRLFALVRRPDDAQRDLFIDAALAQQRRYRARPCPAAAAVVSAAETPLVFAHQWKPWLTGAVRFEEVPGGHHSMLEEPNVSVLADRLRAAIAATAATAATANTVGAGR